MNLNDYEEVWALPYDIPIIGYSKNAKILCGDAQAMVDEGISAQFPVAAIQCGQLDQAAENTTLTDVLIPKRPP